MVLNQEKTKSMAIASTRKLPSDLNVAITGMPIKSVTNTRLLGVELDQSLSLVHHIDDICKKISQRLGILRRIKHFLPLLARLSFYNCLILSIMDFAYVVWGNANKLHTDWLLRLQKQAAWLILDADHRHPSLPLFRKLNWLPFNERVKYLRYLTVYKCLNNQALEYITNMLKLFNKDHSRNTRGAKNLN